MKLTPILIFFLFVQFLSAQVQDKVDFIRAEVFVEPIPSEQKIMGNVTYGFTVTNKVDSIFLDAHRMDFSSVMLDGKKVSYTNTDKKIIIHHPFKKTAPHTL